MRRAQTRRRASLTKMFPAPVGGWIANRNLASPQQRGGPQGAAVLDNFFPTATTVILRRGKVRYKTVGDGSQSVLSLFSYNFGSIERLFAATTDNIYDLINDTVVFSGANGGHWNVVQYAATGNTYLIGVNGSSIGFIYDGDNFWPNVKGGVQRLDYDARTVPFVGGVLTGATSGATGTIYKVTVGSPNTTGSIYLTGISGTFQDNEIVNASGGGSATANGVALLQTPGVDFGIGLTSANMKYVWVYKEALYFIKNDSLSVYYLPVDSIGGTAVELNLGGVFNAGGQLVFGQGWSLDTGQGGGLSEQCAFVTDEGECAIYQGLSPSTDGWSKVGVYQIGKPLGDRAFVRAGADLLVSTSIGMIALSQAIQRDVAAIAPAAVSYLINDAWAEALKNRGGEGWEAVIWPEGQMILVAPPDISGADMPVMFAVNANTMAWSRFTNWRGLCFCVFQGGLYFGSEGGKVYQGNVSGYDDMETYTGVYMPLFEDLGSPMNLKTALTGRAVLRSLQPVEEGLAFHSDFDMSISQNPAAPISLKDSVWGVGVWGTAIWGTALGTVIDQMWRSLYGSGYSCSMSLQVSSGAISPLDTEIIRLEMTYRVSDVGT